MVSLETGIGSRMLIMLERRVLVLLRLILLLLLLLRRKTAAKGVILCSLLLKIIRRRLRYDSLRTMSGERWIAWHHASWSKAVVGIRGSERTAETG
jgi:hypothetical protein